MEREKEKGLVNEEFCLSRWPFFAMKKDESQ
jgi:hypothetical protein